jgi:multidrug resistance efflux pump
VQQAAPAPFDGFIAKAYVKASDTVKLGDILAALDDHDLQLDKVRWQSERQRILLKTDEAMSKHDPGQTAQLQAELAQAELTAQKLARAQIAAPTDGLVVSGDLSQSVGAPVETGKALFEIAPRSAPRLHPVG